MEAVPHVPYQSPDYAYQPKIFTLPPSCGSTGIPLDLWLSLGLPLRLPAHTLCACHPDPSAVIVLSTLANASLLAVAPPQPGAPPFATNKNTTKCRRILDLRLYNKLFPRPPPFHLPSLSTLLTLGSS